MLAGGNLSGDDAAGLDLRAGADRRAGGEQRARADARAGADLDLADDELLPVDPPAAQIDLRLDVAPAPIRTSEARLGMLARRAPAPISAPIMRA